MLGLSTISSLAYVHGQPGQPIVAADFEAWVRQLDPAATVGGLVIEKIVVWEPDTATQNQVLRERFLQLSVRPDLQTSKPAWLESLLRAMLNL